MLFVWTLGIALRIKSKTKILVEEFIAFMFSVFVLASSLHLYGDARYLFPVQILAIIEASYKNLPFGAKAIGNEKRQQLEKHLKKLIDANS